MSRLPASSVLALRRPPATPKFEVSGTVGVRVSVAGTLEMVEKLDRMKADARKERRFRLYAYLLGACAVAIVAWNVLLAREQVRAELLPVFVFSMFIGFAWYFSFSIFPRASLSISLDMAYLMTALCVLPAPLPLAVAFGGAGLGCHLRARDAKVRQNPFFIVLCLNTGGLVMTALAGQWLSLLMASPWPRPSSWPAAC